MLPPDVCPKEDAVRVFLEHLVDPLLPVKCSERATPSLLQQQSVAKQVHAVVILYNYYHRKQSVELEFLYFTTFCKLAVLLRPTLSAYMNWMKGSNDPELTDPEKQFSLTEKAIMDACDVCLRLDPSKETPITKGWPVSKVTVLLVDSRKESFWLQFGSIAQGVWSVIEKSTDEASQNQESTSKRKKICRRPVKDDPDFDEDTLRQLAFSAVKETAGSDLGDLLVLESHVVYSLSKEKSVSCFYIMECSKSPNSKVSQIPAKDVIDRLQEPLITRSTDGWCITSAVEYFLMFPYAGILLEWFSRLREDLNGSFGSFPTGLPLHLTGGSSDAPPIARMSTKVKGLLKGLRYISTIFEEGEEQEMVIGFPTDVKHVAHIGMDGPSDSPPSWMDDFKQSQGEGDVHKVSDGDSAQKASEGSSGTGAKAANSITGSPARDLPEVPKPRRHSSSSSNGAESPTKAKSEKRRHHRRSSKGGLSGSDFLESGVVEPSGKAKHEKPHHSRRSSKGSHGKDFLEPQSSEAESESGLESPKKLPDIPKTTRKKKSKDSEGSTRRSKAIKEGGIENRLTAVS
ncbi:hypothetical protein SAY86_029119 [Trapa natans]|uniref:CRIB domain-containing protein n=1 Tax=Trapa natans TaxID=22666 RepID=A0AAN7MKG8_TRANT|nr:hypothetical protein SAY86_029119 [Trapa natans]